MHLKGTSDTNSSQHILILNPRAEERSLLQQLCPESTEVDTAPNLEQALHYIARTDPHVAVVDASMADYSRLKGLFRKRTSLILTGSSESQLRRIARGWPRSRHLGLLLMESPQEVERGFGIVMEQALTHSSLLSEVDELRTDREKRQVELREAFLQINQIKRVIESSVVKEMEKRLSAETRLKWFRREKQRIESLLKKIYLATDVTSLLDIFIDIQKLVKAESISFYLLEENDQAGEYLKPLVWDGGVPLHTNIARLTVQPDQQDFAAHTVRETQEINLPDIEGDRRVSDRYRRLKTPLRNILSVPIRHAQKVIGVLEVYNKIEEKTETGFTTADQRVLRQLSEHISIAITKLNLIQYDALTGLLRPDAFYEQIIHKLRAAYKRSREASGYALVMGDVDWFKNYNDRNGHEAGNRLLRELANTLKASIREEDLICRYGGEEFLFFLPGIRDQEQALIFTDRIRKNVEDHFFENQEFQPRGNLTMSFGITCFDRTLFPQPSAMTPDDLKRLITEADLAMAEAKGKLTSSHGEKDLSTPSQEKNRISVFQTDQRGQTDPRGLFLNHIPQVADEKRKSPRYPTSLSLIYKNGDGHQVTKTINLSLGGAKISTDEMIAPHNTLDLTLVLGKSAFQCKGDIVYSRESAEGFPTYYSGLKFWDLSLNDRQTLEAYISSLSVNKPGFDS